MLGSVAKIKICWINESFCVVLVSSSAKHFLCLCVLSLGFTFSLSDLWTKQKHHQDYFVRIVWRNACCDAKTIVGGWLRNNWSANWLGSEVAPVLNSLFRLEFPSWCPQLPLQLGSRQCIRSHHQEFPWQSDVAATAGNNKTGGTARSRQPNISWK